MSKLIKRIVHLIIIGSLCGFIGYKIGIKKNEINLKGCETMADEFADQLRDREARLIYCKQVMEQIFQALSPEGTQE